MFGADGVLAPVSQEAIDIDVAQPKDHGRVLHHAVAAPGRRPAGAVHDIGVAAGVHHHPGLDPGQPRLRIDNQPAHRIAIPQDADDLRVKENLDARAGKKVIRRFAPHKRIMRDRPGLAVALGLGQAAPGCEARAELVGKAEDHLFGPVGVSFARKEQPADRARHAGHRAAAAKAVAFDQQGPVALAREVGGSRYPRSTAPGDHCIDRNEQRQRMFIEHVATGIAVFGHDDPLEGKIGLYWAIYQVVRVNQRPLHDCRPWVFSKWVIACLQGMTAGYGGAELLGNIGDGVQSGRVAAVVG